MATTTTLKDTLQNELDKGQLGTLADVLRLMGYGSMQSMLKVTVASLTAADSIDITTAAVKAAATINVGALRRGQVNLPPIGRLRFGTVRVTAAASGSTGVWIVTDSGGTAVTVGTGTGVPPIGICKLSDDGKTLTFPTSAAVTGFVIEYFPAPATDMQNAFEDQG